MLTKPFFARLFAAAAYGHEDADSPDDRGAEEPALAGVARRRPSHGRALPQPRHRHGDGPGEDHADPPPEVGRHQQVHQVPRPPYSPWIFWFMYRATRLSFDSFLFTLI